MNTLNRALTANAISALTSGLLMILLFKQMASIFEINSGTVFWVIGIGLIYFSFSIWQELKKQRSMAIAWIIIQDLIWVIASFIIVIWRPFLISNTGYWLIDIFAFIVLTFAILQSIGLSKIDRIEGSTKKTISFEREINADASTVWKVISDVANYHEVAPNIDHVEILAGEQTGMSRMCKSKKDSWTETCTSWDEGKSFSFEVNTTAADYPYPFKSLSGIWSVVPTSEGTSKITMQFDFEFTKKVYNLLLHPFMKPKFLKVGEELLDNWEKKIR